MSTTIRPALARDRGAIRHVVRKTGVSPLNIHWSRFLVAETSGKIVGVGQIKGHRDGSRELASIAVLDPYRRQGIASRIIRALIDREKDRHSGTLYLMCLRPMRDYYTRFGFKVVEGAAVPRDMRRLQWLGNFFGRITRHFTRRPMRVIIMALELSQYKAT